MTETEAIQEATERNDNFFLRYDFYEIKEIRIYMKEIKRRQRQKNEFEKL